MKVGRLLLCMLLSVAMVVTFIPVFSFAASGDSYEFEINDAGGITADEGVGWYEVSLDGGAVHTPNYDPDEAGFFAVESEDVQLNIVPDEGYHLDYAYYAIRDEEGLGDDYSLIQNEDTGYYYFTMPECAEGETVVVFIGFASDDSGDYEFDEGATAKLELAGNREFVFDYDEGTVGFQEGDKITITYSDGNKMTFVYIEDEDNDQYGFYNGKIKIGTDYTQPVVGDTSLDLYVFYWGEEITNFDINISVPIKVNSSVKSISFSPRTITVYSENIKEIDDNQVFYSLDYRHKFTYDDFDCRSPYAEGDSITINYQDGSSEVYKYKTVFTYTDEQGGILEDSDAFVNGNEFFYSFVPELSDNAWDLAPGKNNTIKLYYGGASTTFNVFVETPAQRAEAARQGTFDGSMPTVKASKPKAKKKAITVKWKKLKKKQLKAGVSNIEVWVCSDGAFARGATIERVVGKKKSSVKIKGLQKGVTYYAKVRSIKYVNGVKVVGNWSKVKKVKVKK